MSPCPPTYQPSYCEDLSIVPNSDFHLSIVNFPPSLPINLLLAAPLMRFAPKMVSEGYPVNRELGLSGASENLEMHSLDRLRYDPIGNVVHSVPFWRDSRSASENPDHRKAYISECERM